MPKTQTLKSEIQEIQKLKDIAEIMSAIAAGNLQQYKSARMELKSPYTKHYNQSLSTVTIQKHLEVISELSQILGRNINEFITFDKDLTHHISQTNVMNIYIGSDMGFCGKFNNGVKDLAKVHSGRITLLGKQLSGLSSIPFPLPELKVKGTQDEKTLQIIELINEYSKDIVNTIDEDTEVIHIVFNVLHNQSIKLHQCRINRGSKKSLEQSTLKHEFFDLYSRQSDDNIEYIILDPKFHSVEHALHKVINHITIQLLSSAILDSMIAENHARSTSMESTKDEAQQIMYNLNKQMAKERQARITGELIELITSFTSLNQAV
jgi:F0F1-type ATP synthase gamma subunit